MQIRLVALIPGLALAGIIGAGAGLVTGVRYHAGVAEALPKPVAGYFHLETGAVTGGSAMPATTAATAVAGTQGADEDVIIYQCGMHNPPYEQGTPGNCPLCGMPLVAVHVHRKAGGEIEIDPAIVQNMGVRTAMPVLGKLQSVVRAVGTLTEPEQNHREINLRVNGWIQKLYADQEGMAVNAGQPLFDLYSPEITAAADELITARKNVEAVNGEAGMGEAKAFLVKASESALAGARRRLSLLGLTDEQVAGIEKMDQAPATVTVVSPMHGHIAAKNVIEGSAVKAGDELMKIADRSTMWMIVQVFEQQLGQVKIGEKVTATVEAAPGKVFTGKVDFVYPHLDPSTRTAQVRVVIENADHTLHENMFAQAQIQGTPEERPMVLVPREAVLDTGERQVVFLAKGNGHFEVRSVTLGRTGVLAGSGGAGAGGTAEGDASRYVEVQSGLLETDTVVTSGQFLLDSESRLEEARRKFATPTAQGMPGMDMPGMGGGN